MLRTVVSFNSIEKAWLDRTAKVGRVPMTEIVRQAVSHYRKMLENQKQPGMQELLKKTAGVWRQKDGLSYQKKLRQEWDR